MIQGSQSHTSCALQRIVHMSTEVLAQWCSSLPRLSLWALQLAAEQAQRSTTQRCCTCATCLILCKRKTDRSLLSLLGFPFLMAKRAWSAPWSSLPF